MPLRKREEIQEMLRDELTIYAVSFAPSPAIHCYLRALAKVRKILDTTKHIITLYLTMIKGKIYKNGFYTGGVPILIIVIDKEDKPSIPYKNGERVSVNLDIQGIIYTAGIRTTEKMKFIKICPDLLDAKGNKKRLADILLDNDYNLNQEIELLYEENQLTLV